MSQSAWLDRAVRAGYVVKGFVYLLVGWLALEAARGGGQAEGATDALATLRDASYGPVVLWAVAIGLLFYAAWRFIEAGLDPEGKGSDAEGAVKRAGLFGSGVTHAALAWATARLAMGNGGGSGNSEEALTATVMSWPAGRWLVALGGLIGLGVAAYQFYRAWGQDPLKSYKTSAMSAREQRLARNFAKAGLSARGVTFALAGLFLLVAGLQADPDEAQGLGESLNTLAAQPMGPVLLGAVALGLLAYAGYCFFKAAYARFETRLS